MLDADIQKSGLGVGQSAGGYCCRIDRRACLGVDQGQGAIQRCPFGQRVLIAQNKGRRLVGAVIPVLGKLCCRHHGIVRRRFPIQSQAKHADIGRLIERDHIFINGLQIIQLAGPCPARISRADRILGADPF